MNTKWKSGLLQTESNNGIARITLNNPPLNVVTLDLTQDLHTCLAQFATNLDVRVLVVTGTGERAFCAGSDIKEFAEFTDPGDDRAMEVKIRPENATYSSLAQFPKPTIAALNGHALGGGLELAACCDLIVAAENIKLSLPEVNLGVFPGSGGTVRVTRRIGEGRAKEMMLLGQPIDAQTALAWGLINRIAPTGEALTMAYELAERLAGLPNRALQLCKKAIGFAYDADEESAVQQMLPLIEDAFHTDDVREGVRAFFAKEKPHFRHS